MTVYIELITLSSMEQKKEHYEKYVKKNFNEDFKIDSYGICRFSVSKKAILDIVIWTEKKDVCCLVHEAMHATHQVLDWMDLKLSEDSQEAYSYLIEYIVKNVVGKKTKGVVK